MTLAKLIDTDTLLTRLRDALPGLKAVFLFGSHADGTAGPDSDVDIAVLSDGPMDAVENWNLAAKLADLTGRDVDLVDLSNASTVMKFQVISKGDLLWQAGHDGDLFICSALQEYWDWEITRRPIIEQIQESGSVYGR